MECLIFPYEEAPEAAGVPVLPPEAFRDALLEKLMAGWRMLAFFGLPEDKAGSSAGPGAGPGSGQVGRHEGRARLFAILARGRELCAMRSEELGEFASLARECPQTQLFEREIYEECGVIPRGHPWLKGVRITPDAPGSNQDADYGFFRIQGGQTHEVGVGPIHAGIIEPGHFRFQCYGENVLNLEISLGYQHRGIAQLLASMPAKITAGHPRLRLVECIAGDASVAHATAQCALWEKMLGITELAPRAQRIRRIGLELERLACHCGDLGAIAGDTGFLPTSAWNGRIRGDFLNLTALVCGNRFGREYVRPGGAAADIGPELCEEMLEKLAAAGRDAIGACEVMFSSASVMERMDGTGALSRELALELGLVGVPARACGIGLDARFQFPLSSLPLYGTEPRLEQGGDVLARARVRYREFRDSLTLVRKDLEWLAENPAAGAAPGGGELDGARLPPGRLAVALAESWRGEVCHVGLTGPDGNFLACRFVDPSFHNWAGLALALRDGQISDFPLCNKSFNLSYCGHDL